MRVSRARAKGTTYENQLLSLIRVFAPTVDRAPLKGVNDKGDFVNVPWPIEAKNRVQLRPLEWAKAIKRKAADGTAEPWWWLCFKADDKRTKDSVGDVTMMPTSMAITLAEAYVRSIAPNPTPF